MNWNQLFKILAGQAGPKERQLLEEWLEGGEAHRRAFASLQARYRQNTAPLPDEAVRAAWEQFRARLGNPPLPKKTVVRPLVVFRWVAAASILLLLGLACLPNPFASGPRAFTAAASFRTGAGERKTITLADGSTVWLNHQSRADVDEAFNGESRKVRLRGEGFFQVAKNARKPFYLLTGNFTIRVLGTSFHVYTRQSEKTSEVAVATGLVEVRGGNFRVRLKPSQKLIFHKASGQYTLTTATPGEVTGLQTRTLHFHKSSLPDIAGQLIRYYGLKVNLVNPSGRAVSFSGTVRDTGLRPVLEGICFANGLRYELTPAAVTLYAE